MLTHFLKNKVFAQNQGRTDFDLIIRNSYANNIFLKQINNFNMKHFIYIADFSN